jgi:hypothetical protein
VKRTWKIGLLSDTQGVEGRFDQLFYRLQAFLGSDVVGAFEAICDDR